MLKIRTDYPRYAYSILDIHVEENILNINGTEYQLEDIKSRMDFRSFCLYVFPLSNLGKSNLENYIKIDVEGESRLLYKPNAVPLPFERYSNSYNTKFSEFPQYIHINCPISVVFYPETKNFRDALMIVTRQSEGTWVPLTITTTDSQGNKIPYEPDYEGPLPTNEHLLPKCLLTADSTTVSSTGKTLNFKYRNINAEDIDVDFTATAKCNKGYISHSKFDVKSGRGSFKFIPLGLDSGEKVKVQVGIGKYTDICNLELTVE